MATVADRGAQSGDRRRPVPELGDRLDGAETSGRAVAGGRVRLGGAVVRGSPSTSRRRTRCARRPARRASRRGERLRVAGCPWPAGQLRPRGAGERIEDRRVPAAVDADADARQVDVPGVGTVIGALKPSPGFRRATWSTQFPPLGTNWVHAATAVPSAPSATRPIDRCPASPPRLTGASHAGAAAAGAARRRRSRERRARRSAQTDGNRDRPPGASPSGLTFGQSGGGSAALARLLPLRGGGTGS